MLDEEKLSEVIESLAVEVETVPNNYLDVGPGALKKEGDRVSVLTRITLDEYCYGGRIDNIDKHSICLKVLETIMQSMPPGRCRLYWREKPIWETYRDQDTKDAKGTIYCRLGWYQLDKWGM